KPTAPCGKVSSPVWHGGVQKLKLRVTNCSQLEDGYQPRSNMLVVSSIPTVVLAALAQKARIGNSAARAGTSTANELRNFKTISRTPPGPPRAIRPLVGQGRARRGRGRPPVRSLIRPPASATPVMLWVAGSTANKDQVEFDSTHKYESGAL